MYYSISKFNNYNCKSDTSIFLMHVSNLIVPRGGSDTVTAPKHDALLPTKSADKKGNFSQLSGFRNGISKEKALTGAN